MGGGELSADVTDDDSVGGGDAAGDAAGNAAGDGETGVDIDVFVINDDVDDGFGNDAVDDCFGDTAALLSFDFEDNVVGSCGDTATVSLFF